MIKTNLVIISISLLFICKPSISQENQITSSDFPVLKGPYLGQKLPGLTPEIFAPEIFSKIHPEWAFCTEFTPDGNEFYFSECDTSQDIDRIMCMKRIENTWTKPEVVSFSGEYNDNDQRLSPDGNIIFWRSWRPLPGNKSPEKHSVIWFAIKTEDGWSEASPIKYGNNYLIASYPSITKNGILYFSTRKNLEKGKSDIYSSPFKDGYCDIPKSLGNTINTEYTEGDLYVAPDESFLIVSCWHRPGNKGESDLYISFRDRNGTWSKLINMGEPINTENNENCPSLSPDGKYFFYMSANVNKKPPETFTYWIEAGIIEKLKSDISK